MLPSRLFRNMGIPPLLRSSIIPHASLPATVAVQLRFRSGVIPGIPISRSALNGGAGSFSTSSASSNASASSRASVLTPPPSNSLKQDMGSSPNSSGESSNVATTFSQQLPEKMEPKLSITFTCTVPDCDERSTHQFTKRSYTKGIVIIQCPGCKNRHLIADNLGWFKDSTEEGKLRNIEDILKARGETVRRGRMDVGGVVEYTD
ncbi:DNL zinc finger-domain-containing protein [Crassisporium funariophilum]|nr:DNL zinc finger-domain-containing protein [Crassisporium funariophilum]